MMRSSARAGGVIVAAAFVLVFTMVLVAVANTSAQTSTQNVGDASSFKVSPVRTDIQLRPGESRSVPVFVENLESRTVFLKPIGNDFVAGDDERGIPAIILDEGEFAPTHSLKRFMAPLDVVTVQPGERKQVDITINVPSDAQAGGYYGALRFVPADASGGENVNVSGSVASLILLTVPGNTTESLQLTNFAVTQDGQEASRLSSPDNVGVTMRVENKGNIHVAPFGSVFVLKDGEQIYNGKVNDVEPAGVVLPDSARVYEVPVENLENFGQYTFKLVMGYGSAGQTIEVEKSVWIIPTLYIILAIGGLVLLLVLTTAIVLGLRAYKKRILRNSRRRR